MATARADFGLNRRSVEESPAWSIGMEVSRERVETDGVDQRETRTELAPVIAYAPPNLGRIELRARRVWVSDVLPRRRPVFEFGLDFGLKSRFLPAPLNKGRNGTRF